MRFAIKTRPEHQAWEELRDIWLAADEIPLFESVWNWDHFYPLTGDLTGSNFEGWTMLSAMAALTKRIRIGCQVTGMPYRHPAVLANMAATVDIIAGGRLILGLGAAWNEMECTAYGIPLPPLKDPRCEPKPVQRPYPPITIGGNGPKRTLRTAARWATEWNATIQDPAGYTELKAVLAGHCAAIGRDFSEITCSCLVRSDGEDDLDRLVASLAQWRDAGADLAVIGVPLHAKPEFLTTLAEALAPLA